MIDAEGLIAFEKDVAARYERGEIRAPVHLDGGNEDQLIKIFAKIRPADYVCGAWRQHYHCLLKGVPSEELLAEILAGRSISLQFPKYRVYSSAIAGGIVPIALGIALGIKAQAKDAQEKVWCFVGDMTASMGCFAEAVVYATGHKLSIEFVIEDNARSVYTPTQHVWGDKQKLELDTSPVTCYGYVPTWPHSGVGRRIEF